MHALTLCQQRALGHYRSVRNNGVDELIRSNAAAEPACWIQAAQLPAAVPGLLNLAAIYDPQGCDRPATTHGVRPAHTTAQRIHATCCPRPHPQKPSCNHSRSLQHDFTARCNHDHDSHLSCASAAQGIGSSLLCPVIPSPPTHPAHNSCAAAGSNEPVLQGRLSRSCCTGSS